MAEPMFGLRFDCRLSHQHGVDIQKVVRWTLWQRARRWLITIHFGNRRHRPQWTWAAHRVRDRMTVGVGGLAVLALRLTALTDGEGLRRIINLAAATRAFFHLLR